MANDAQPTAGPWKVCADRNDQPISFYSGIVAMVIHGPDGHAAVCTDGGADHENLAVTTGGDRADEYCSQADYWPKMLANARLIAAAPEMLAALKHVVDVLYGCIDADVARNVAEAAIAKAEGRS